MVERMEELMKRRKSPQVTREMAIEMHKLASTGSFQHEIAAVFRVNQGRVSEVLSGKRYPELRA
jgi:predicted XRE-type DNA-binding protein